jgi:hypothetical protein
MGNITKDIGNMIVLAQKAYAHVKKNKINKARRELKKIIRIDIDELTRLQKEQGDKKIIEECGIVFNDAKKALRDLDSLELFDEAKQLIDEIIKLEGHEASEISEDEKILNRLYQFWYDNIYNSVFYHGTNSIALERIKVYGLSPGMTIWDKRDIIRLDYLIKKSGWRFGIGAFAQNHIKHIIENKYSGIFITLKKQSGIQYAKLTYGGEIWTEFFNLDTLRTKDKNCWIRMLYFELMDYYGARAMSLDEFSKIKSLFDSNKKEFFPYFYKFCKLERSEINEVFRISEKYWNIVKDSKPVLISISAHAPAIREKMHYGEFKDFVKKIKEKSGGSLQNFSEKVMSHVIWSFEAGNTELEISKRIPHRYMLKYDYL